MRNFYLPGRHNGLRLRVLCGCRRHLVIMVYRPALLRESLRQPERRAFLQARGYPVSMGTGRLLDELSRRMRSAKAGGFPHEIGLFLGYPLEDVTGFIAAGGAEYRCSGCWKVYGDVQAAEKRFAKYQKCTNIYCALHAKGRSIEKLAVAVKTI